MLTGVQGVTSKNIIWRAVFFVCFLFLAGVLYIETLILGSVMLWGVTITFSVVFMGIFFLILRAAIIND